MKRRRRVILLSYAAESALNHRLLVQAFEKQSIAVEVVEPHRVKVAIGKSWVVDPYLAEDSIIIHRTVRRHADLLTHAMGRWLAEGVLVLNDFSRSLLSRDKFATAQLLSANGIPVVPSVAAQAPEILSLQVRTEVQVLKPSHGLKGEGVTQVTEGNELSSLPEVSDPKMAPFWILQPYVDTGGTDLRAFVVRGTCVALMRRTASSTEWRANMALGASGTALSPDCEAGHLAAAAVNTLGLDYAGVDLLTAQGGLMISEIDAWAGFAAIGTVTNIDVAGKIVELAKESLNA